MPFMRHLAVHSRLTTIRPFLPHAQRCCQHKRRRPKEVGDSRHHEPVLETKETQVHQSRVLRIRKCFLFILYFPMNRSVPHRTSRPAPCSRHPPPLSTPNQFFESVFSTFSSPYVCMCVHKTLTLTRALDSKKPTERSKNQRTYL